MDYNYGAFGAVRITTSEWSTDQYPTTLVEVERIFHPIPPDELMPPEVYQCLRINVPNWFQQPDFVAWLSDNDPKRARPGLWTWYTGGEPSEYSDTVVIYDRGDGSDSDMPQWAWDEICAECEKRSIEFALVWMTNLVG